MVRKLCVAEFSLFRHVLAIWAVLQSTYVLNVIYVSAWTLLKSIKGSCNFPAFRFFIDRFSVWLSTYNIKPTVARLLIKSILLAALFFSLINRSLCLIISADNWVTYLQNRLRVGYLKRGWIFCRVAWRFDPNHAASQMLPGTNTYLISTHLVNVI